MAYQDPETGAKTIPACDGALSDSGPANRGSVDGEPMTTEQVRRIAHDWAIAHGVLPSRAVGVVDFWRAQGRPVGTRHELEQALAVFFIAAKDCADLYHAVHRHAEGLRSNWAIETVKHLALINLAGLAGAVTLLASATPPSGIESALHCFVLGMMLTLVTFILFVAAFSARSSRARGQALAANAANSWAQLETVHGAPERKEKMLHHAAALALVAAFVSTLAAAFLLAARYWN